MVMPSLAVGLRQGDTDHLLTHRGLPRRHLAAAPGAYSWQTDISLSGPFGLPRAGLGCD